MNLMELAVRITADDSGVSSALTKLEGNAKGTAATIGGKLAKGFKGAAAVGTALVGTAMAIGTAIGGLASKTAAYGDNIDKMSQKIGISAEAYQKWDYVMKRAGTSVDSLKMGMKTLSSQAEKGSDAFNKLGISQNEVKNLSQEELFEKTIKGLSEMEAGTERTTLATQLLGRAGVDLAPLLNEGTDAIEEQLQMAEAYGMVMSDEAVKASAAWEDSLTTLQGTMTGFKNRMMAEFLPSMTTMMDGLALVMVGKTDEGTAKIGQGVEAFISKMNTTVPRVMEVGGKIAFALLNALIESLPKMLEAGINMIVNLADGVTTSTPTLIPKMVDAVLTMVKTLLNNAPKLLDAGIKLIFALAKGVVQSIPNVIKSMPQIITGMITALRSGISSFTTVGGQLVTGLYNGIKDKIAWVVGLVKGMGKSLIDAVKGVLGVHSPSKVFEQIGDYVVQGFANGISPIGELTSGGTINLKTAAMPGAGGNDMDMASAMYEAVSAALDNHVISFNNRELGRLVKSYV